MVVMCIYIYTHQFCSFHIYIYIWNQRIHLSMHLHVQHQETQMNLSFVHDKYSIHSRWQYYCETKSCITETKGKGSVLKPHQQN